MSVRQIVAFATCMLLIVAIAVAEQFKWLPNGKAKTIVIFLVMAIAMGALWMGGLPPQWFDGSKTGFGLAGMMLISGIVPVNPEERSFRRPFFMGLGLVLLAANVVAALRSIL
jgi:hypothetical protein